jgi:hypothetical protein
MTNLYTGLSTGPIDADANVINAIADEAIHIGDPVILVAAGTGELLPRVEPNGTQGAFCYGVVVDGDGDGRYDAGARGTSELVAAAAGDTVVVCTRGRCIVRVNGSTAAILMASKLTLDAVDGKAELGVAADEIFARALQAATGNEDLIACDVQREGADA